MGDGDGPLDVPEGGPLRCHEEFRSAGWKNSPWEKARGRLIHDGDNPPTDVTVLQAAFNHVESVARGESIHSVTASIRRSAALFPGDPSPDEDSRNRYPSSWFTVKQICHVSDLSECEEHMCDNPLCPHLVPFVHMRRPDLLAHIRTCQSPTCHVCKCPCGGERMYVPATGAKPLPRAPCFVFRDVIQEFFLDADWVKDAEEARANQSCNFYRCPEGQRILQEFAAVDVPASDVRLPPNCLFDSFSNVQCTLSCMLGPGWYYTRSVNIDMPIACPPCMLHALHIDMHAAGSGVQALAARSKG